jgi:hypothetical protein
MQVQAYQGCIKQGDFIPHDKIELSDSDEAILIILGKPAKKADIWAEFDRIVSTMDEKPQFEDFTHKTV